MPGARKVRIEGQPEQPLLKRGATDPIADIEEGLWLNYPILQNPNDSALLNHE
jgi:hypothetical protein